MYQHHKLIKPSVLSYVKEYGRQSRRKLISKMCLICIFFKIFNDVTLHLYNLKEASNRIK